MSFPRLAGLFVFASLGLAETHTGILVNSKCYDAEERNVNPFDTLTGVDRDRNMEVRRCAPRAKTKEFAVLDVENLIWNLDPAGNDKAADLVRNAGKKSRYVVDVIGETDGSTIRVEKITLRK